MLQESKYQHYSMGHGAEFPSERYISEKTGKPINLIYFGSLVMLPEIVKYVIKCGFTKIHEKRSHYDVNSYTLNEVYEYTFDNGDIILIGLGNKNDASDFGPNGPNEFDEDEKEELFGTSQYRGWIQTSAPLEDVYKVLPKINKYLEKDLKGKIHLLKSTSYGFETESFELPKPVINELDLNYGSGFTEIHNNIINTINNKNDNKAKLVLLHGDPGTGKTTYIKYLAHELGKKVLFLPPFMAESIVSPEFVPFLMENKDCVLIIEDAEKVIGDRQNSGSSVGVSNLLNLSDGILGDILNIHIIATFNMDKEKIDSALLRKGRLIAEHKFGPLSVDDTNKLLGELDKETTSDKGLTLAEIYNIDNKQDKSESERQMIGFRRY